jgi:cytoskeleton protein RodZ
VWCEGREIAFEGKGLEFMSSVSEELKRERELRGISLEEIADETKIGIRFLAAIDEGRLEVIPGEFYRRASIRAYARYLGIDDDRILATYQFRARSASPAPSATVTNPDWGQRPGSSTGAPYTTWLALLLLGVGLSGAAVAFWPGGESKRTETEAPPLSRLARSPQKQPMPEPVIQEEVEREPESEHELPLRLRIQVNEPCWLEIRSDGELAASGLMLRGFQREIRAREEIRLWLGNAGGIAIWLNGQPGLPLGRTGEVRKDIRITPANLQEFILSEAPVDEASSPPRGEEARSARR